MDPSRTTHYPIFGNTEMTINLLNQIIKHIENDEPLSDYIYSIQFNRDDSLKIMHSVITYFNPNKEIEE